MLSQSNGPAKVASNKNPLFVKKNIKYFQGTTAFERLLHTISTLSAGVPQAWEIRSS